MWALGTIEDVELDVEVEMINSVAPTLQWAGNTGTAYAITSLYVAGEGVDNTSEVGGYDVNDVKVCTSTTESPERSYNDRQNALESVTSSG